jgi:S-adenosylmethionine decarboxylase
MSDPVVTPLTSNTIQISAIPGLHIIANLAVEQQSLLQDFVPFRSFIDDQITFFGLSKVGEVYHDFPNGGYTGVVCLTESHLSIHTWPEHHYLTFDVFLSNYQRDNREITKSLYKAVTEYFGGKVLFDQIIQR